MLFSIIYLLCLGYSVDRYTHIVCKEQKKCILNIDDLNDLNESEYNISDYRDNNWHDIIYR